MRIFLARNYNSVYVNYGDSPRKFSKAGSLLLVIALLNMVAPKGAVWLLDAFNLGSFSTDSASQLDVLGHDSNSLGVNGAQVGVFKQTNKIGLAGLLKGHHCGTLEAKVGLEVLSDFSNKSLERKLADQQLGGFLVPTDLTKCDCTRSVTMGLLHSTSGWRALASSFGGKLFTGSFSSGGFTSCLLGTGHYLKTIYFHTSTAKKQKVVMTC